MRRCKINTDMFKTLLSPTKVPDGSLSTAHFPDLGFIKPQMKEIDLNANSLENEGLKLLNQYFARFPYYEFKIDSLGLYENCLSGDEALNSVKGLITQLPNLRYINLEGNYIFKLSLLTFNNSIQLLCRSRGYVLEIKL